MQHWKNICDLVPFDFDKKKEPAKLHPLDLWPVGLGLYHIKKKLLKKNLKE